MKGFTVSAASSHHGIITALKERHCHPYFTGGKTEIMQLREDSNARLTLKPTPVTSLASLIKREGSSMQRAELAVQRGTGPRTCQISEAEDGRVVALGRTTRVEGCSGEVPVHAVLPAPGETLTRLCPAWQRGPGGFTESQNGLPK